jgi:nicotinate-nucleotide pyrophosphorylase (carboxylating)
MTSRDALTAAGLNPDAVTSLISAAFAEDLGVAGDVTSAATIPAGAQLRARFVSRAEGIAAGLPVLEAIAGIGGAESFEALVPDGAPLLSGTALAEITGRARAVLALERTALNIIGHLSGVATVTGEWVAAVAGTNTRIRDTRKTMPLLRELDKYAVRCGGGVNHRRGRRRPGPGCRVAHTSAWLDRRANRGG